MNIMTIKDNTGFAPKDYLWSAIDDETYDGADDSNCPIGHGATPEEAIVDLMEQLS